MAIKYQVFISSTYEDLRTERDQVIKAVLEIGHIPVGMEMFSAADEEQWKIIARHIDESDYYAVIAAHRYGSVTEEGLSFTRKEYEYARSRGIPILGFVIEPSARWPADRVDTDSETKALLDEFKERIREKPISFWASADDLYGKFSVALTKAIAASPREGWVRASSSVVPQMAVELARLSAENAALRDRIASGTVTANTSHEAELDRVAAQLVAVNKRLHYRYTDRNRSWQLSESVPHVTLFAEVAPRLLVEEEIRDTARFLALALKADRDRPSDIVAINQVKELLADWNALDLVEPSTKKHSVSDTGEYWTLSEFGREVHRRARRRRFLAGEATDAPEPKDEEEEKTETEGAPGAHA